MVKARQIAFWAYLMLLGGSIAYAGTTDNLGLSATWTVVAGWFTDGYILKIVSFLLITFTITLAIMKQYLYAIVVLIMTVIISNLTTVVTKFASATF